MSRKKQLGRWALIAACGCILGWAAGCDDGRPDVDDPPEGMGRLVVDNRSPEDLHAYFDGEPAGEIRDGKYRTFDLPPGEVRVTLDQSHSDRMASRDVDILRDRIVVMEVEDDVYRWDRLDVFIYLD